MMVGDPLSIPAPQAGLGPKKEVPKQSRRGAPGEGVRSAPAGSIEAALLSLRAEAGTAAWGLGTCARSGLSE